jgi:hypothetical protein
MVKSGQVKLFSDPKAIVQKYWVEPAQRFITPVVNEIGREQDRSETRHFP